MLIKTVNKCAFLCVCVSKHACIECMCLVTIWVVCVNLYRCNIFICLVSSGWFDAGGISDGRTRCSSRSVCRFPAPVWRNRTQTTSLSSHRHWRGERAILYRECYKTPLPNQASFCLVRDTFVPKYHSICNFLPLQFIFIFISIFIFSVFLSIFHIFSFSVQELLLSSNDLEDLLVSAKDNDSIRAKLTVSINTVIFHLYCM